MVKKRDPWIRIMVAAHRGVGLHLTAEEVLDLSDDGAIEACATNGLEDSEGFDSWASVDPMRLREPGNRYAKSNDVPSLQENTNGK